MKNIEPPPPFFANRAGVRVLPASIPLLTQTTAIDLDVTHACNLACVYCFKRLRQSNHMTLDTARDSIEWLIRASGTSERISVNFMGGEPTLRFAMIQELVAWGNRRGRALGKLINWSLTSNMTLWNDEIRAWVDQNNIGVLMSIDGCPEVQDAQRPSKSGKPQSEAVFKWAKSMLRTRPQSMVRLTISSAYVSKLFDSCAYLWSDIGFETIAMGDCDYEGWSQNSFLEYDYQLELITDFILNEYQSGHNKFLNIYRYYVKHLIHPLEQGLRFRRATFLVVPVITTP